MANVTELNNGAGKNTIGIRLQNLLSKHLSENGHAHKIVGDSTLFDVFFTDIPVNDYRSSRTADTKKNAQFNQTLRVNGILKSPSKMYPCLALTETDFDATEYAIQVAASAL